MLYRRAGVRVGKQKGTQKRNPIKESRKLCYNTFRKEGTLNVYGL